MREEGEEGQYLGRECETQNKLMTSLSFNFPIAGQFIFNEDLISKFLLGLAQPGQMKMKM